MNTLFSPSYVEMYEEEYRECLFMLLGNGVAGLAVKAGLYGRRTRLGPAHCGINIVGGRGPQPGGAHNPGNQGVHDQ